jgi:ribonuclease HI
MSASVPHFLLFSESKRDRPGRPEAAGQWRFVLEAIDGSSKLTAADKEPVARGNRLELLAVVRGLEALDQPSRVTLVTPSRYVSRGIRYGLDEWRRNGWRWERYGEMAQVKNSDLWRRVDRALRYHKLECRTWRFDPPDDDLAKPVVRTGSGGAGPPSRVASSRVAPIRWLGVCARLIRNLGAWRRPGVRPWSRPAWAAAA